MNLAAALWIVCLVSLGYFVRCAQEYRFFHQYRQQRRRLAEVAVDTARMLNGITDKVPAVALSPLIRQYLTDQKMLREKILAWFSRREPYLPRHSASGMSTYQRTLVHTGTAPLPLEVVAED
jgi:hypothetical protein